MVILCISHVQGQVGFFKWVVRPLYSAAERFFAPNDQFHSVLMRRLQNNMNYWQKEADKENSVRSDRTNRSMTNLSRSRLAVRKNTPRSSRTGKTKSSEQSRSIRSDNDSLDVNRSANRGIIKTLTPRNIPLTPLNQKAITGTKSYSSQSSHH